MLGKARNFMNRGPREASNETERSPRKTPRYVRNGRRQPRYVASVVRVVDRIHSSMDAKALYGKAYNANTEPLPILGRGFSHMPSHNIESDASS